MFKNLLYIVSDRKKETFIVIFWEVLHSIFVAAPSGILLVIIWELFSPSPDTTKIRNVILLMGFVLILQFFVAARTLVRSNIWIYDICTQLRIRLGNHIQKLSLGFFKKKDPGEIAAVVLQDVANFEAIFGHSIGNISSAIFGTTVLSCFLFAYDWRLALCLLAAIPIVYPFILGANRLIANLGKKQISARNSVGAKFLEYVQGIRHLKSYGLTGDRHKALREAFAELRDRSIQMEAIPGPLVVLTAIVFEVTFLITIALGLYFLAGQTISTPVLITFLIMGYNLYGPLKVIAVDYLVLRYANESLSRVIEILETPVMETPHDKRPLSYDITFNHVSFGYQKNKNTVSHLCFTIPDKSVLALVGHSGSGKTTIASLIARFWDVDEGNIRIGDIDIRHIQPDYFYTLISEVFQDVYLFDDTIYANIRIGKPEASEEEIQNAIDKSQSREFIDALPEGVWTKVGEGGSKLSGGQKQRISIARALLKDAPIILLDEATASLDPENEIYIQRAIQDLVQSKTVVVIAHKLATIRHADQILVLEEGKITERGKHLELLSTKGTYHKLWNIQQQSGGWKIA